MNKAASRITVLIEIALTGFFLLILADTSIRYYNMGSWPSLKLSARMISLLILLIFPLITHLVIRIQHRSNSAEGELIPFLFLSFTLECVSFLPEYYTETGRLILDPVLINIIIRFSFLFNALTLLFISLLLIGVSNNSCFSHFITALVVALLLAVMAPNSSAIHTGGSNFGSDFDLYFNYATDLVNLAAIVTFIGAGTKDTMSHNIGRYIAYILLILGNFGLFAHYNVIAFLVSSALLCTGCVMLMIASRNAF